MSCLLSNPQKDDSLLSSDLSIELNHDEEQLPSLPLQENESEDEEEEDLPSFLMQKNNSKEKTAVAECKRSPQEPVLADFFIAHCIVLQNLHRSQKERLCGADVEIIHTGLRW